VTNFSGLDHLEGETIVVTVDGYSDGTEYTVTAGAFTLPSPAAVVHAGLPYDGTIQLLKLSDGNPTGTGQTQDRRIYLATLRLDRSQGIKIGREEAILDALNYDDSSTELFTGDIPKVFQTTWSKSDEIIIRQDVPMPANILAIIFESEVNSK